MEEKARWGWEWTFFLLENEKSISKEMKKPAKKQQKEDLSQRNITDKGSEGRKGLVCSELEKAPGVWSRDLGNRKGCETEG